jgi:hypothetical protein
LLVDVTLVVLRESLIHDGFSAYTFKRSNSLPNGFGDEWHDWVH